MLREALHSRPQNLGVADTGSVGLRVNGGCNPCRLSGARACGTFRLALPTAPRLRGSATWTSRSNPARN